MSSQPIFAISNAYTARNPSRISRKGLADCIVWISARSSAFPIRFMELGGVKTLNLYMMGEPFVNKNLADFIRIAKRKKIADRVIITSNGSLLTEDASRRVIEAGLDFLRISIYGGDSEPFARKTQSKNPAGPRGIVMSRGFKALRDEMKGPTFLYVKMIDSGDATENQHFLGSFLVDRGCDEIVLERS